MQNKDETATEKNIGLELNFHKVEKT